jgi:prephenate dehydrogenase
MEGIYMIKVEIIGMGFMGCALAYAIKKSYQNSIIIGKDKNPENIQKCISYNLIQSTIPKNWQPDFIFIATPVKTIPDIVKENYKRFKKYNHTIISDIGSVKENILSQIYHKYQDIRYISSHPMSGSEKSGPQNINQNIFYQKPVILIPHPTNNTIIPPIKEFWEKLGANVFIMSSKSHDKTVSILSHIPHILSYSLLLLAKEEEIDAKLSGRSFYDITRIGKSSPTLWSDILIQNANFVSKHLPKLIQILTDFKNAIEDKDNEKIKKLISIAKSYRENM